MPHGNRVPLGGEVPLTEARLTAQNLQEAGIPCFLRGEAAALIAAEAAHATVRIEVDEEDFEHAQRVLAGPVAKKMPDADEDSNGLATVEVFYDSLEAQHAANLLRARGIPCGLRGTTDGGLSWLSAEVPRLRLEVHASDLEKAFEVLGFTVEEGEGEEEETDQPAADTARTDRIRKAEPEPARQLQRHPFQQTEPRDAPAEVTAPAVADSGTDPSALSPVEAGAGGVDVGLVVVLLLVAGGVLGLGLFLLL